MKKKLTWLAMAGVVGILITTMFTVAGRTAVSELAGIAVAQSAAVWTSVKDATIGDNITSGILATGLMLYDGTNFDRARGTIANGLAVDVTRIIGNITPSDTFANPTTAITIWSLNAWWDSNASLWKRWQGTVAPTQAGTTFNQVTNSAANTAQNIVIAAVAGQYVHLYHVSAVCSIGGTASLNIMDGATTIEFLPIPSDPMRIVKTWPVGFRGTLGNSMTVNASACGVAGSVSSVTVQADRY